MSHGIRPLAAVLTWTVVTGSRWCRRVTLGASLGDYAIFTVQAVRLFSAMLFCGAAFAQDALKDAFISPPEAYGPVPFFWWTGEPLNRDRMVWELDQLKAKGFSGVNVNYTHTMLGHSYKGSPPLFSDRWWEFWEGIVEECAKRNMTIGFDDYIVTHGNPDLATVGGQIHRENPETAGLLLRQRWRDVEEGDAFTWGRLDGEPVVAMAAYRFEEGALVPDSRVDLEPGTPWTPPGGHWRVSILYTEPQAYGVMNPLYARQVIARYFELFERHSRGLFGKAVNYFFQDELEFGGLMPYWSAKLLARFRERKGYDLTPELTSLFEETGARTPKIRLDYYDVAVEFMEEAYFRPIFEWCQDHGIIYGHDQAARADVVAGVQIYGDYFRTLRWYHAPGTDRMPELIRGKVCASISQLYDRPRTWFEAYHSTGWGVTPEDIRVWDSEALMYGYNLLSYHSLYYTTRAGWWAWAPGDIHFRQPYWDWMRDHYAGIRRLCFLLAQGHHQCDVAVLFPTSTVQADMKGTEPGKAAQACTKWMAILEPLFKNEGLDFDFIDDESMATAEIADGRLQVAGGSYRVLILPAVKTIRWAVMEKVLQFSRQQGAVIALGCLPDASDRAGAADPELDTAVAEIFNNGGGKSTVVGMESSRRDYAGGFEGQWLWASEPRAQVFFKTVWPQRLEGGTYDALVFGDNQFILHINGVEVAQSDDWQSGWRGTVELSPGDIITVDSYDSDGGQAAGLFIAFAQNGKAVLSTEELGYAPETPGDMTVWRTSGTDSLSKPDTSHVHPAHLGQNDIVAEAATIAEWIDGAIERDVLCSGANLYVMHRRIEDRDVYAFFNPSEESCVAEASLRGFGSRIEEWNPWSGAIAPLHPSDFTDRRTQLQLQFDPWEIKVAVVYPGAASIEKEPVGAADGTTESVALDGPWSFTVEPVLDNRWGDFKSPASNERVAPEARQFRYAEEGAGADCVAWSGPGWDDASWPVVTSSWGPRFWLLGPVEPGEGTDALERLLASLACIDPAQPVKVGNKEMHWQPYEFSLRWGIAHDPLLEGQTGVAIHGPIGWVPDTFLHLQAPFDNASWCLWTSLDSASQIETRLGVGTRAGFRAWLNGNCLMQNDKARPEARGGKWNFQEYPSPMHTSPAVLREGTNPFSLMLRGATANSMVRAFVTLGDDVRDLDEPSLKQMPSGDELYVADGLVASQWYTRTRVATFNCRAGDLPVALWFRFRVPPGLVSMRIASHGIPQVWVGGRELIVRPAEDKESPAVLFEGAAVYIAQADAPIPSSELAVVRMAVSPGFYGGAAIPEPIVFQCATGEAMPGDWADLGLATYSGAARYARTVYINERQAKRRAILCLGDVSAAAEVRVNGKVAGRCLQQPWRVDVSEHIRPGDNSIEIVVVNTLASHYSVGMPCTSRYVLKNQTRSGLFGPIRLELID